MLMVDPQAKQYYAMNMEQMMAGLGSTLTGDESAAPRYIEARLTAFGTPGVGLGQFHAMHQTPPGMCRREMAVAAAIRSSGIFGVRSACSRPLASWNVSANCV